MTLTYWTSLNREWLIAAGVIVATIAIAALARAVLKWVLQKKKWGFLHLLEPSISNLIYVLGLKLLIDLFPFQPKLLIWVDNSIYILAIMILYWLARKMLLVAMEWGASRTNASTVLHQGFLPIMRNVVTLFIFLSGSIIILKHFNYDVMSLITALGVSSLAVGLAAKETLSNMISGFMLIIDRNLKPGDRVNLSGIIGEVDEIGLRSTRIKTGDGNMLIVPNAELVNTKILNLSSPSPQTSCSTLLRVPSHVPFEAVKNLCLKAIDENDKIHKVRGNWIHLTSLSEGHQLITIGFWVRRIDDQGAAISELNLQILEYLNQAGIPLVGIPR